MTRPDTREPWRRVCGLRLLTRSVCVFGLAFCALGVLAPTVRGQELVPPIAAAPKPSPQSAAAARADLAQTAPLAATPAVPANSAQAAAAVAPNDAPGGAQSLAAEASGESDAAAMSGEPSATVFARGQVANLEAQLHSLEAERANPLWPRLAVGAGLGASVLAAGVGAAWTFGCDGECSTPTWVSLVVVVGAAVGVLGSIWWMRTDTDRSRLELRKHHIEYELERWNQAALQRQGWRAQTGPQLSMRFAL